MEDSIFTKIIKGDIPCYKLYEDDDVGDRMKTKDIEEALLMIHWMSQSGDFGEYSKSDRLVGTPDDWKPDDINEAAKAAHKYWKKHGRK